MTRAAHVICSPQTFVEFFRAIKSAAHFSMRCIPLLLLTVYVPAIAQTIDDSGFYFDPVHPGQSLSIERDGHDIIVVFYTYDPSGNPLWLVSTINNDPNNITYSGNPQGRLHKVIATPQSKFPYYTTAYVPDLNNDYGSIRFTSLESTDGTLNMTLTSRATINIYQSPLASPVSTWVLQKFSIGLHDWNGTYTGLKTTYNPQDIVTPPVKSIVTTTITQSPLEMSIDDGDCVYKASGYSTTGNYVFLSKMPFTCRSGHTGYVPPVFLRREPPCGEANTGINFLALMQMTSFALMPGILGCHGLN